MERKASPSEIIFAINFYISDEEKIEKYIKHIKKYFLKFYRFDDIDAETMINFERIKTNIRGKDVDHYLFSPNLSLDDKLTIIEDFYKNDAFWLFTFSEISIAFNISWKILHKLEDSEKRTKNSEILENIQQKINLFRNIISECFLQINYICEYSNNCRFMYGDVYMPTPLEEKQINDYPKTLVKNKKE